MTADDLTRLRAVAEAATPGPWSVAAAIDGRRINGPKGRWVAGGYGTAYPDAVHIATFDPPTVAALIDRVERAERERDDYRVRCDEDWRAALITGDLSTPEGRAIYQAAKENVEARFEPEQRQMWHDLETERDSLRSKLAALRAAVAGLADEWDEGLGVGAGMARIYGHTDHWPDVGPTNPNRTPESEDTE